MIMAMQFHADGDKKNDRNKGWCDNNDRNKGWGHNNDRNNERHTWLRSTKLQRCFY